ncbi:nucleoside triphosphate pyrophosphohydrolase family protein [Streptoalloteichus hindustanus]|uniref:Uncharacterized protein n=1 Tax=Streptoalloteichus hindustanus TaxID=2017 RepID=A0A1M4ZB14_STRHI|nr:hypothetical protein [Streptoalloteichus hindustanus]SHF15221.1 hypothetical protein SAMN05444320_102670 [Streptoalloteichus hindustanus]
MITGLDGAEVDRTTALYRLSRAFDLRFPEHDAPEHRLGRLCEEVGELAEEVLFAETGATPAGPTRANLVKELRDVLRAAVGLARHYEQSVRFTVPPQPSAVDTACAADSTDSTDTVDVPPLVLVARLAVATGDCARWVHHDAGMGVKVEKHGVFRPERLGAAAQAVVDAVAGVTAHYALTGALDRSIEDAYRRYQWEGFLGPEGETTP